MQVCNVSFSPRSAFLTKSAILLHYRQIPYAIGQFTVNEFCHELALRNMTDEQKLNLSNTKKLSISLGSGITAGFAAAILSHVGHTP